MSGVEPFLASLFASAGAASGAGAAGTAAASAAGTAAGAGAAGSAAATAAAAAGAGAAGAAGLTAAEIASSVGAAGSAAGTGASLLEEAPKLPDTPKPATRDAAQEEADLRSELYKKRGRGAALLTPGRAAGDKSTPNLGSAALLGS